jgi:hypothetical protein
MKYRAIIVFWIIIDKIITIFVKKGDWKFRNTYQIYKTQHGRGILLALFQYL